MYVDSIVLLNKNKFSFAPKTKPKYIVYTIDICKTELFRKVKIKGWTHVSHKN